MSVNLIPEFKAHFIIRGKIKCETGLHIGGSKEKLEIGGVDSIVVRSPRTNYPYIPGSSVKGKMRHLLEYITGAVGDPIIVNKKDIKDEQERLRANLGNVSKSKEIVRLFGIGANEREEESMKFIGQSRLTVRDAFPDKKTKKMWKNDLGSDANYTEYKAENTIDRLTSAANPRFIERVVEGSAFNFEIVYSAYHMYQEEAFEEETQKDISLLLTGLRLLENVGIGKSGSRGYGQISFHLAKPVWVRQADYQEGNEQWKESRKGIPDKIGDLTKLCDVPEDWFKYSA